MNALLVFKVTLVLLLAAAVTALLRRRSAATRHLGWLVALLAALVLVPLSTVAPRLWVPVPESARRAVPMFVLAQPGPGSALDRTGAARASAPPAWRSSPPAPRASSFAPVAGLEALWLAGALGVLLWSVFGHLGLWALLRSSLPVERGAWPRLYGVSPPVRGAGGRARVAHSSVVGTPLTWGWWRPVVLLPSRCAGWPLARRRAALLHELAHVERLDYLAQFVAMLTCAVYWFHPLAWWAAGRLRSESEHACDDRVLAAGTPAPAYAGDLLAVAHGARGPGGSRLVAIGMARRTHLEGRLLAVLDESRRRGTVRPIVGIAALALTLLILVPFAGLEPGSWAAVEKTGTTTATARTRTRWTTRCPPSPAAGSVSTSSPVARSRSRAGTGTR